MEEMNKEESMQDQAETSGESQAAEEEVSAPRAGLEESPAAEAMNSQQTVEGHDTQQQPPPQQPVFQQPVQLPPGYAIDPASGQGVFVGYQQPVQPSVMYVSPQLTPEQVAAQQAAAQQRYGVIMQSVESFVEGDATVSDVVKTLYANTAQDDQLWKGLLVGAAATILLTSGPVREAMGKTFGSVFPGLKETGKTTVKPEPTDNTSNNSPSEKE